MIKIVPATAATDFAAVAQLYYDTWQVAYRDLVPAGYLDQLTPATWQPEKRENKTLLALADNRLAGVCAFGPARDADFAGAGELYSIYVHPAQQHQGIGQLLLQGALARLEPDFSSIYLVVQTNNLPARRFYKRQGFHATGYHRQTQTDFGPLEEVIYGSGPQFEL
ncbi:GNAT family N-acetyltransferase [Lacticaseibacillus suibinensis]|uniref:GNAT family N-acetyltransferase n=1 Tax=Lacticaseibacillus suibinensis TaxID=2486011 RepID=UPI001CDC639E|nr:GNAT family N-acetyltransferase [Lacticaseibacillus suibinensis]